MHNLAALFQGPGSPGVMDALNVNGVKTRAMGLWAVVGTLPRPCADALRFPDSPSVEGFGIR